MHKYKCVEKCPDKYSVVGGNCVLTGFFCPFGYIENETKDGCMLDAQVCEGNDILNYDKTKCIPEPGLLIPFPMVIAAIVCAFYLIKDKKKNPNSRFFASFISVLGLLESFGLVFLVILSKLYGIRPSYSLSLCALLFLIGLNLFFGIVYVKQLKSDSAFKYWEQEFEKSTFYIVCLGVCANCKTFRLFYCRYQDRKDFNAVFSDEGPFYQTLVFTSIFYFLTGSLPIMVASIFGLVYIRFGYQLQMFCIEMLIIEIALLICIVIELYKLRKNVLKPRGLNVTSMKRGFKQTYVRANIMQNDQELTELKPSSEVSTLQELIRRINVKDAGKR